MIRPVHPVAATVVVQLAALALVLGHPSVAQSCAVGVAALLFLLANDSRDPAARFSQARIGILTGGALATAVALLITVVPVDVGGLGSLAPLAVLALYPLATVSWSFGPRRRNRGNAPDRR